jgi:Mat/Ecp fimbriae major subunit
MLHFNHPATKLWLTVGLMLTATQSTGAASLNGTVSTRVMQQITLTKTNDLRFGAIIQQTAINRITINQTTGARTASRGAATLLPSLPFGRAQFQITGQPSTQIRVTLPANFAVTRIGGGTMTVNTMRSNTTGGLATLNASGQFGLNIGARLNVNANQLSGLYSGNFNITVNYN